MKLDEIIDVAFQVKHGLTTDLPVGRELGAGSFSYVLTHADPHLVVKNSGVAHELATDPYFQYVHRIVEDNLAAENPYFPRIYGITVRESNNFSKHHVLYHVEMEKLVEIRENLNLSSRDSFPDIVRIFGNSEDNYIQARYKDGGFNWGMIVTAIDRYLDGEESGPPIVDPKFKEALDLIKEIRDSNEEFFTDIRIANMMLRRTSVGMQLVLTDPLYNNEHF